MKPWTRTALNLAVASVWFLNGFGCKVLNLVPRHREIVARILGESHAGVLTPGIGILETLMAVWILSRIAPRFCALLQIGLVLVMNAIEFFLAPDLLLFGQFNAVFAVLFTTVVYINGFMTSRPRQKQHS